MQNTDRQSSTQTCLSCEQETSIYDADVCELCYAEIMGFDLPKASELDWDERP